MAMGLPHERPDSPSAPCRSAAEYPLSFATRSAALASTAETAFASYALRTAADSSTWSGIAARCRSRRRRKAGTNGIVEKCVAQSRRA